MLIKQCMKGPNEIVPFDHPFIRYPQYASTKMDGFRLLNMCGEQLLSPALKPFPNRNIPTHLKNFLLFCKHHRIVTDGEFWSPEISFQQLQSITRSHDAAIPEHVKYYLFDAMREEEWDANNEMLFEARYNKYFTTLQGFDNVVCVPHSIVNNAREASVLFDDRIAKGEEGIILRAPAGFYKHGRCTTRQDGMWKFKQFVTHDAVIVGFEQAEKMREGIDRGVDAQGKLQRTYKQADYEAVEMLGAFWVRQDGYPDFKVKPGKGCDNEWKMAVWMNRPHWLGKHIEYKFMPHGTLDKPRIGNFVRTRPDLD